MNLYAFSLRATARGLTHKNGEIKRGITPESNKEISK